MSASTSQRLTTLGNYSFAHNPPTPQSNRHNGGVNVGSSSPAMESDELCTFQMLDPNNYSSSASSQHVATTSDMHAVVPMMANSNIVPWTSDSPSSRNAVSWYGSPHDSPTRSRTSSHPATERIYLSPLAFPMPGPIGHPSPVSSQYMSASDMHSVIPMMANPNAAWWTPDNLKTVVPHGWSQNVSHLQDLEDARSRAPSHSAMERVHLCPHSAFPVPDPTGHTSTVSSQHNMTALDTHPVVPMMVNPNAVSWTTGNLRTAISHGPSQSGPYLHDLGVNSSFQLPLAQLEPLVNQLPLLLCQWVHNNARCGYKGTLEDIKQHWHDSHLPGCPGTKIRCQWEQCSYHKRGNPSNDVMFRSSVWRHISEVHLMRRRNH